MGFQVGRGLFLGITLLCLGTAARGLAEAPTDEQAWSGARASLARGQALFDVQNYDGALAEFMAAHRALEGHPRQYVALHNIAACHERMFRYDRALHYYQLYLERGGPDADDRAATEAVVRTLERLLGHVRVRSNVPAEIWIDDRHAGDTPTTLRVPPGKHLIELRAPVHEPQRREVYLEAGTTLDLAFELSQLSQFRGLDPMYFWVGSSLTLAALVAGGAFGIHARALSEGGHERAGRNPYLNTVEDESAVRRSAVAADIAFASAALFGVSSLVLFFVSDWESEPESRAGLSLNLDGSIAFRSQL